MGYDPMWVQGHAVEKELEQRQESEERLRDPEGYRFRKELEAFRRPRGWHAVLEAFLSGILIAAVLFLLFSLLRALPSGPG